MEKGRWEEMMTNSVRVLLVMVCALPLSIFVSGCRKSTCPAENEIKLDIARMSLTNSVAFDEAMSSCERIADVLLRTPSHVGTNILAHLGKDFGRIPLDEHMYNSRAKSLTQYCRIVKYMVKSLRGNEHYEDWVWRFQLLAFDRINQEMEHCRKDVPGGRFGAVSKTGGQFQTQRQYLANLHALRFDMIRTGFETGDFTSYFYSLPAHLQKEWIRGIEVVAHRQVVIWNPKYQLVALPIYEPEDQGRKSGNGTDKRNDAVEEIGGGKKMRMIEVRCGPTKNQ